MTGITAIDVKEAPLLSGFGRTQSALMQLLLRNKGGLTVDQIAEGLGVTRTAVNQHLSSLERDGHVVRRNIIPTGGRPSRQYALSDRGMHLFPKNYDMFSLKTLEALVNNLGAGQVRKVLTELGRDLGTELGARLKTKPLSEKLSEIVSVMQELGFDAKLDEKASKNEPTISAYNCIYHTLAQAHPDVCELDLALLREASSSNIEHLSCMAKGANECRFKFQARHK